MAVYTLGIWTAKVGHEEEFVEAWHDMAKRTEAEFPGSTATLLRDRDRSNVFISFGPWESLEQVETWRGSATFGDGVTRIREHLAGFEPRTMDPVATVG